MRYVSLYQFTVIAWMRTRTRAHWKIQMAFMVTIFRWIFFSCNFRSHSFFLFLSEEYNMVILRTVFFSLLVNVKFSSWPTENELEISPKIESTQNQFIHYLDIRSLSCHEFPIVWSSRVWNNAYSSIDHIECTSYCVKKRNILFHSQKKKMISFRFVCVFNDFGIGIGIGSGTLITFRQLPSWPVSFN